MSLKFPDTVQPSQATGDPLPNRSAERCKVSVASGAVAVSTTSGRAHFYSEIWVTVLFPPTSIFAPGIVSAESPSYFTWAGRIFRTGAIALPVTRRGRIDHYTVRAQAVGV